jgi:hypothetical protein
MWKSTVGVNVGKVKLQVSHEWNNKMCIILYTDYLQMRVHRYHKKFDPYSQVHKKTIKNVEK